MSRREVKALGSQQVLPEGKKRHSTFERHPLETTLERKTTREPTVATTTRTPSPHRAEAVTDSGTHRDRLSKTLTRGSTGRWMNFEHA